MKIRQILIIVIVALTAVLTSCSGDGFRIDGNIAAIKGTMVRVVFDGDSGIVDELVNVDNKVHFTYEGESAQPVLVSILDMNGNQLMTVVAKMIIKSPANSWRGAFRPTPWWCAGSSAS